MEYMENMQQTMEQPDQPDLTPPGEESILNLDEITADSEEAVQYGPEEKKKRSPRRKKSELPEPAETGEMAADETPILSQPDEDEQEQWDGTDESIGEEEPLPQDAEPGELTDSNDGEPTRTGRRKPARTTVLDSYGNVIHEQTMSGLHDISILTAARNARRILTATVDAIETDGEALPRVVFYVGTVKVMIPFNQMGFDLDPEKINPREARMIIDSMLGAKIDYMIRGVDTEARIAAASRRDAMLVRQHTILNARGTSQRYRIREGMRVTARVVYVSQYNVRVEIYGFETYIPINSISNVWLRDVRKVLHVGEERPVEIQELIRGDDGRVTSMQVSMKMAEDAPQLELREGNTYTGHITGFSETAYFIRVVGIPMDVRCPVKSNHTMELLSIGDYVKFYIRGIHDGVPTGAILKVLKKQIVSEF